jgi:TonB family protein
VAKKVEDAQAKLKSKLAGGLFRYTFMISFAFHFGIWGVVNVDGKKDGWPPPDPERPLKFVIYENLPPPPSIEQPERKKAPKGLETVAAVGKVPLPVRDEEAEADTISDAIGASEGEAFGEGTVIIVVENIEVEDTGKNPWDSVSLVVGYDEPPVIIKTVRPKYPEEAREAKIEGDVTLLVYIDENGDVRNAIVQFSRGSAALEEAAKKAAMKCKFKPAKRQGVPVGVWYSIVMQFRI